MTIFEYLLTLASFMLALGIGHLLTFAASLYHRRGEVRLSVAHTLWVMVIFLAQLEFWLGAYQFSATTRSSLPAIAFVIVQPTLLYLASAMVAPEPAKAPDLRAYHASEGRGYIAVFLASELVMTGYMIRVLVLNPGLDLFGFFLFGAIAAVAAVAALLLRSRWVQVAAPAVLLVDKVVLLYFVSLLFTG